MADALTWPLRLFGNGHVLGVGYGPSGGKAKRRPALAVAAAGVLLLASHLPGEAAGPQGEPLRILALGDSLVAGYGLAQGDGFVPQLERWLGQEGVTSEVVNAGVSGDTTAGGLARFDWTLEGRDADALIVVLGGNDLLRGIDPAASRANLAELLTKAGARGLPVLLAGMRAPGNYGPEWKAAFDAMYPDLAATHGTVLYPYFLAPVIDDRSLWQPDGIHPNAAGVGAIVRDIGPSVLELVSRATAAR